MAACLLQPKSVGSVTLRSADPTGKPWIRNNFLSDPDDVQTLVDGLRKVLEIARSPALAPYCEEEFAVPQTDDASLRAHLARRCHTLYHPVGTCAMGKVVDDELRVNGIEGLRVVDASVIPVVPRGNTHAPAMAVAEKAADLIRGRSAATAAAATADA
jgi:choline dehydrogenase